MSFVKDFIAPISVLTVICIVVSGILSYVYGITQPIILQRRAEEATAARLEVLAAADDFTLEELAEMPDKGVEIYSANNGAGYAVTANGRGYGGDVTVMFGITSEGTIEKVKVLNHTETPGLGTKVTDSEEYLAQYVGKDAALEGIDSVSGATVSSNALLSAANTAFEMYAEGAGVELSVPERAPVDPAVLSQVYPNVASFTRLEAAGEVYKADEVGYVYVGSESGFIGPITIAVGLDNDGAITNIAFAEINETAGYGSQLTEESYLAGYVGKKSGDELDSISGSTISSDAFNTTINNALDEFATYKDAMARIGGEAEVIPSDEPVEETSTQVSSDEISMSLDAAMERIFPGEVEFAKLNKDGTIYKAGDLGYVYTGSEQGFVDEIALAVGLDNDGAIAGVVITSLKETVGFGTKLADLDYLASLYGKTSADTLDTISGATVSSEAFNAVLTSAFENYETYKDATPFEGDDSESTEVSSEIDTVSLEAMKQIFSGEVEFTQLDTEGKMYKAGDVGYAYAGSEKGFVDEIAVVVGIDNNGAIAGVVITSLKETDGFGTKLQEADYLASLNGKTSADTLDTISGATVSSEAFNAVLTSAFENYETYKGGE